MVFCIISLFYFLFQTYFILDTDFPTSVIGEFLKQQVEDRLTFYETGENPAKNIDVMRQAVSEVCLALFVVFLFIFSTS